MPRIRAASIDEHKTLTRRALLDSAKALIADAGTAEIPLGEVALASGVGRTTLYDYFTDRDDLIATMVEDELPGVLARLIDSVTGATPSERLADLATRTVEFVVEEPVLGLILHRDVGRLGAGAQERIRTSHAALADEMVSVYYEGVASGEFRSIPPDLAGRFTQDVIMSAARAVMAAPDPAERIDEITANLRTFLIGGLQSAD
jgi:AcrR family transcriptional regulator